MLSPTFRSILLTKLKLQLKHRNQLLKYQSLLNDVWKKPWVVYCKPPFSNAQQIVKYLGQYSHRVAISNHRIINVSDSGVTFFYKDYRDESKVKPTTLSGVEFLRRFSMHILPKRFVKIRYYGILSTKQKDRVRSLLVKKPETKVTETRQERIVRITGFNYNLCPVCKTGFMHTIELLPKIRAPTNVLYATKILSC
jgi:Txe/YoeB family toxin of Txe-Axe toxin-antitoxin module